MARGKGLFDSKNAELYIYLIHLHSFDHQFCSTREAAKHQGAVNNRKQGEEAWGMNNNAKLPFDQVLPQYSVCGLTMLRPKTEGERVKMMIPVVNYEAFKTKDNVKAVDI